MISGHDRENTIVISQEMHIVINKNPTCFMVTGHPPFQYASCHTFDHSFATHLLEAGYAIGTAPVAAHRAAPHEV
ncbi:hypothetical protein BH23GEM3_BH23GEM3_23470 [soil metagenome]